jgi:hypothetical protein
MPSTALQREFIQVTEESAFGTIVTTPVRGTNQIVIRLPGSNQFTMRPNPVKQPIPYGGGFQVIGHVVSDKTEMRGQITTPLCYSQAKFLLDWSSTRIDATGTIPWTTTEPQHQYASCTIDHAIMYDDTATIVRKRYTGVKVDKWAINISEDSQYASLRLDVIGSVYQGNTFDASTDPTAAAFPIPADSDFPSDFVLWIHSGGGLTIGATTRTQYTSIAFSGDNQSDVRYYANRFVNVIRSFGSMFTLDADITLISTPDDRAALNQILAQACQMVFNSGAGHTITVNLYGNNYINTLADDTAIGKIFGRKLNLTNRYDYTAGNWFTFTYA